MSTIWITGARGFIGRHLAAYLAQEGHIVLGLGHGAWPDDQLRKWGVSFWLNGDIETYNLRQLLSQSGCPEVIYHLAGGSAVGTSFVSPLEDFNRTVDSTARLLEWIRRDGLTTKTICISSAAVVRRGSSRPHQGECLSIPLFTLRFSQGDHGDPLSLLWSSLRRRDRFGPVLFHLRRRPGETIAVGCLLSIVCEPNHPFIKRDRARNQRLDPYLRCGEMVMANEGSLPPKCSCHEWRDGDRYERE